MNDYNIGDTVTYSMLSSKCEAVVLDVIVHTSILTWDSYTTYLIGHSSLGLYKEDEVCGSMLSKEDS